MNNPTPISAAAAHYTGMAQAARAGSRISPADLRVRAGQLLNDAADDRGALAQLRLDTASLLAEAAHHLAKIDRLSRVGGQ